MKGYIHIYTGNGKGKTTAALGMALRAAGAGKKVFIAQFVKGQKYSETEAVEKCLPEITLKQYGRECFIIKKPAPEDRQAARKGLEEVTRILKSGAYDLIVLDEATIALYYDLFSLNELKHAIQQKREETELIITGRYAPQELIEIAGLVTEMKEIKHYYNEGVKARKGIEY
jgi:cob(I)alamin adenosyltransferase